MSLPPARRSKASSTQVFEPPFLWKLPLAEAITTGRAVRERMMDGAAGAATAPKGDTAAAKVVVFMKARRDWRGVILSG